MPLPHINYGAWLLVTARLTALYIGRPAAPATTEIGMAMPDPRHMDATQTFAGWPAVALHLSRRLRLDPAAATADLATAV